VAYNNHDGDDPSGEIRIRPSARKHGIDDARIRAVIRHAPIALENPVRPGQLIFLGPDHHGNPLEVIAFEDDEGVLWVIHAMRLRPRYRSTYLEVNGHP